jgi:hypothetical protein
MSENWLLGLHWGIKKSFLDYVARMPDGRGIFRDGATLADGSIAVFEPDVEAEQPEAADADLFLAFHGDIHFSGHFGMLNVRIADPWITMRGSQAEMTVLDPYHPEAGPRLPLVRFTLESRKTEDDMRIWLGTEVHLTQEATGLFNDVYRVGEQFESIAILLRATNATAYGNAKIGTS